MRAFQQTLIEMAFLHAQVRRGSRVPDASERMAALNGRASALRPYLLAPPIPPPPARGVAISAR
jgi:protease PrsW